MILFKASRNNNALLINELFILLFFLEDELHTLNITINNQTFSRGHDLHRHNIMNFFLADISCCKRIDSNPHKSKTPFLPPSFRHSTQIWKLIKVTFSLFTLSLNETSKTYYYVLLDI